ncbi:hypothetical protein ZWY2020_048280 [Hordeum vulgare]|nr:hypothetical protein ZWY2020_048280 [Hordeum vulgare]
MEHNLGCQKAIEDLDGDNQETRRQYGEIARWFPSVQMMRNHARDLVKVMTDAENLHAFPDVQNTPVATVFLWVHMVGSVLAVAECDKEIPIDVEKLTDVIDLQQAVIFKKEVQDGEEVLAEEECKMRKEKAGKRPIREEVCRFEGLKMLKE